MNVTTRRELMSTALGVQLGSLPPLLTGIGNALLGKFMLGNTESDEWTGRFSDLTLLYPSLHDELSGLKRGENLDAINLAHAWLIIHTFVEDRLRDRQIESGAAEYSFASYCLGEGLAALHEAGCLTDSTRAAVRATMRRYYETVDMPYLGNARSGAFGLTDERVIEIASGRAAFGWIATEAKLISAGVASETRADLARAFDLTVTGMQWVDDISDWHEDITTGDDNLLLVGLKHFRGMDAYGHPANELRSPNVAHALVSNEMFGWAEQKAIACFEGAREIFEAHGLAELEGLLQKRIVAALQVRQQEEAVCTELVKTAVSLFRPST